MSISSPAVEAEAVEPPARAAPQRWPWWDAALLAGAVAILGAAATLSLRGPTQVVVPGVNWALPETCSFRQLFGVGCAGCGLTRCFIAAAHGDLLRAWHFSPVGLGLFALVAVQAPYRSWRLWQVGRGRRLPPWGQRHSRQAMMVLIAVVALLLLQWIVRLYAGGVP